jgi:hypothetical protein
MSTLKDIVERIKESRATATLNPDDVEPRVRAGVEGQVRQAQREISDLETEYRNALLGSLIIVGCRGANGYKFMKEAGGAVLCVDENEVVSYLTKKVGERVHRYEGFTGQEYGLLLGALGELKADFGILSIPPIKENDLYRQVAQLSLFDAINKLLRINYGTQLHEAVINKSIADKALAALHSAPNLVVCIVNYTGLSGEIVPKPAVLLDLKGSPESDTFVEDTVNEIKEKLGGKTKKKKVVKEQETSNQ